MKKLLLLITCLFSSLSWGQSVDEFIEKANKELEAGNSTAALASANKALELQPDNIEARWIKVRSSFKSNLTEDELAAIVKDLDYIIDKGRATGRVYNALGLAETELASSIYRWKKAKNNTGLSDDNSQYIKQQTAYYNESISHYNRAISAYNEAIKVNPDEAQTYRYKIKDAEAYIAEIKAKITELK